MRTPYPTHEMNALVEQRCGTCDSTEDQTGGRGTVGASRGGVLHVANVVLLVVMLVAVLVHVAVLVLLGHVGGGKDDLVDDVDDAVVGEDVGSDDGGVVDHDTALGGDLDGGTVQGLDGPGGEGGAVGVAGNDVVGEDLGELGNIGQESLDGALGQGGEGLVGGGKDGKWAVTRKSIDETSGLNGGDEGGKAGVASGNINDAAGSRSREEDVADSVDDAVAGFDVDEAGIDENLGILVDAWRVEVDHNLLGVECFGLEAVG